MESSDSLVSQASSLPPRMCENPEYLPPALPPKRNRNSIKMNNLNITPPSSPKLILSESVETPTKEVSSQAQCNNHILSNNRNKIDTVAKHDAAPTSPSSNYVQISTSTINALAEAAKQTNDATKSPKSPTTITSNKTPASNHSSESFAGNNDVRVIYTNVNFLNSTNNRSSDESHYIQLYDGSVDDHTANSIDKMPSEIHESTAKDHDRRPLQQSNSPIINNNNNNSINDKNANDEEDIVVLRRPHASSNSSLKVPISSSLYFFSIFGLKLQNCTRYFYLNKSNRENSSSFRLIRATVHHRKPIKAI